jgi:hypothetical protein
MGSATESGTLLGPVLATGADGSALGGMS